MAQKAARKSISVADWEADRVVQLTPSCILRVAEAGGRSWTETHRQLVAAFADDRYDDEVCPDADHDAHLRDWLQNAKVLATSTLHCRRGLTDHSRPCTACRHAVQLRNELGALLRQRQPNVPD